jgi:hypothetical protein
MLSSQLTSAPSSNNTEIGKSLEKRSIPEFSKRDAFIVNGVEGFSPALSGSILDFGIATINSASIKIDSTGVNLKTTGRINGHQPFQIKLGEVGFDVTVNSGQLATVIIRRIDVVKGSPDFGVEVNIAPMLDPKDSAILAKVAALLAQGDLTGVLASCRSIYVKDHANEKVAWISKVADGIDVCPAFF